MGDAQDDEVEVRRRGEPEASRGSLLLVVSLVCSAAAIVALVFLMMKDKGTYAKPVDELARQRAELHDKSLRAEGFLVRGSLEKRANGCEYRFRMRGDEAELPVHLTTCAPPDNFHDDPEEELGVTVEGRLLADDSFEATTVLTKCPSKYKDRRSRAKASTLRN